MAILLERGLALLSNAYQFHQTTGDVPVLNIQVAVFVPVRSVRAAEDPFDPLLLRYVVAATFRRIRIVAEHGDNLVALVQDHDSSL